MMGAGRMALPEGTLELLKDVAARIAEAQRPVRIMRTVSWTEDVAREFFANKARELPKPTYRVTFEVDQVMETFQDIRRPLTGDNEIERFLRDTCDSYVTAAQMLAAVGTRNFHQFSKDLYGHPNSPTADGKTTNLSLARHFDAMMTQYADHEISRGQEPTLSAEEVAEELGRRFARRFAPHPIRVEVDDTIAANAVAGADVVRIKRGAMFTERDVLQLEHHEGSVHVATTLNGRSQSVLPLLGLGAPRTTNTQEGLAIFTEFISQAVDLERVRRLTDRILAIELSEQGADFLDLYKFFLEHDHAEDQAYDCARRVVRGGLVEGGAPFTKDVCYLDGLLRVSNFLRVAIAKGHPSYVPLLFVGKLDLHDIPLAAHLRSEGVLDPPRFLPRWARDLGFLTAYMSYSAFLNETDLTAEHRYYDGIIERAAAAWDDFP
jgi:uncharacterized protein (TIGR02421 family)